MIYCNVKLKSQRIRKDKNEGIKVVIKYGDKKKKEIKTNFIKVDGKEIF